jgi:hypothetical protein
LQQQFSNTRPVLPAAALADATSRLRRQILRRA